MFSLKTSKIVIFAYLKFDLGSNFNHHCFVWKLFLTKYLKSAGKYCLIPTHNIRSLNPSLPEKL